MNLKKLRTSKNLSLVQASKGFTFPHKVWVYQDAPLDHTLLHKYEQGERAMPKGFLEKYREHIKTVEVPKNKILLQQWKAYKGKKCSYSTFYNRIRKMDFKLAIKPVNRGK